MQLREQERGSGAAGETTHPPTEDVWEERVEQDITVKMTGSGAGVGATGGPRAVRWGLASPLIQPVNGSFPVRKPDA